MKANTLIRLIFGLSFVVYLTLFFRSLRYYWFNPRYTNDDAQQQLFPFYEAIYPGLFSGDLVAESMSGYLAPLHYWVSYGITLLTENPNLTGHWVMLIQLSVAMVFLALLVNQISEVPVVFFSLLWFLHTRNFVERMTVGLPRGWVPSVILATLYFIVARKEAGVLISLLLGILLNPPAAFMAAVTYGFVLVYRLTESADRSLNLRMLKTFILLAPVFVGVAYFSTQRPPEIGEIETLESAQNNPAFSNQGGRFGFLPFADPIDEIGRVGLQVFVNEWHDPGSFIKQTILPFTALLYALLVFYQYRKQKILLRPELLIYGVAIFVVYSLSRKFAFTLYVPDRHLQFPLNLLHLIALPPALWTLSSANGSRPVRGGLMLLLFGALLFGSGGTGLRGAAGFNTRTDAQLGLYKFISSTTPPTSVVAGHPTRLDGVQLFGRRRGYITTETAHPFYDRYFSEVSRRLARVFKALYAKDGAEFISLLENERIDYFVFHSPDFTTSGLQRVDYHLPFRDLVKTLARRCLSSECLGRRLFSGEASPERSSIVYADSRTIVVDISKLKKVVLQ